MADVSMLRAGIWPVHPLAHPDAVRFGDQLPEWVTSEGKELFRRRLKAAGCGYNLMHPVLPEHFGSLVELGMIQSGHTYLRGMLDHGSILVDQGYVNPDALAKTLVRIESGTSDPRDWELAGIIPIESAARAYQRS